MPDALTSAIAIGTRLVGTVLTLPGAAAAELLAEPFDVVWVDLEHGALGPSEAQEMIIGAQAAGAYALVRLPADAHGLLTAMLDAGADGVVLANIDGPETAAQAMRRVAHPPEGTRGWGPRRVTLRRRTTKRQPPRPSVWLQIESTAGVEQAPAIAAVAGVDAIVVGMADLSFSLGSPLDFDATGLLDAVRAVRRATAGASVAFGVAGALQGAPSSLLEGASILVHSTDARLCAQAVDCAADWLRAAFEPDQEPALP